MGSKEKLKRIVSSWDNKIEWGQSTQPYPDKEGNETSTRTCYLAGSVNQGEQILNQKVSYHLSRFLQIFDRVEEMEALEKYMQDLESTGIFAQTKVTRYIIGPTSDFTLTDMLQKMK